MKNINRRGFLKLGAIWGVAPVAAKFLRLGSLEKESEPESDDDTEFEYSYNPYLWDGRTIEGEG